MMVHVIYIIIIFVVALLCYCAGGVLAGVKRYDMDSERHFYRQFLIKLAECKQLDIDTFKSYKSEAKKLFTQYRQQ